MAFFAFLSHMNRPLSASGNFSTDHVTRCMKVSNQNKQQKTKQKSKEKKSVGNNYVVFVGWLLVYYRLSLDYNFIFCQTSVMFYENHCYLYTK